MRSILFYGDSNTWGYDPGTTLRYPYELRWTTICAARLGDGYDCIPAGMNGRTTAFDDPVKGARNGIKGLDYELQTHKPLDLMVIMLGTNDLKYTDAKGSAAGMEQLIDHVLNANQRFSLSSPVFPRGGAPVLLISPVFLEAHVGNLRDDITESVKLAGLYQRLADKKHIHFMDASRIASASNIDGVHLGAAGHMHLGEAVAEKIGGIFEGI